MRVGIRYLEPSTPPDAIEEVVERVVKRAQSTISDAHVRFDMTRAEEAIEISATAARFMPSEVAVFHRGSSMRSRIASSVWASGWCRAAITSFR